MNRGEPPRDTIAKHTVTHSADRKRWDVAPALEGEDEVVRALSLEGVSPLLGRLLYRRGVRTPEGARAFLHPDRADLHDPYLMLGMERAVLRMERAIASREERIFVYADCDADGFTSAALLCAVLERVYGLGDRLTYYVPGGEDGDYGVHHKGVDEAQAWGASLIIFVDCGSKATDELAYARSLGMEAIICDHHSPGDELPEAVALLNPKQGGETYPFADLSGCGVTFKFAQALLRTTGRDEALAFEYLDLVSLSIIADNVPMLGENRTLACLGLEKMKRSPLLALQVLMSYYHINPERADESTVTFKIAPLLNASGRMMRGAEAVRLLLSQSEEQARGQIGILRKCNEERRQRDRAVEEEAQEQIRLQGDALSEKLIGLYAPHWYRGVLGVVASRLAEQYARPVIVMARQGDRVVGSARSPRKIGILNAFASVQDLLVSHGGHPNAVGFVLEREGEVGALLSRLEEHLAQEGEQARYAPHIDVDMILPIEEIRPETLQELQRLKPFGLDNRMPIFATYGLRDAGGSRVSGRNLEHLSLRMSDRYLQSPPISGMALGRADMLHPIRGHKLFDVCYRFRQTDGKGARSLSLDVLDIRLTR